MEQDIRDLLHICVPTLGSAIEIEVDKPITNFRGDSYPRLATLDKQIPGVGMHFVIWSGGTPFFPFNPQFDGIVRPLSYIPYFLASNVHLIASRFVTQALGGHVHECVKEFCRTLGLKLYTPLGRCVDRNRSALGEPISSNIISYCSLSWNKGKHKWHTGSPESVIPIQNTLGCYFIARSLGAHVLQKCNRLDALVKAAQHSRQHGRVYNRPELV